jgi:hypothetical protein
MPTFLKFFLPLALLAGCSNSVEKSLPQTDADSKSSAGGSLSDPSQALTTEEARQILPEAASLSRTEMSEILESPPVSMGEIKNQSLTALLLAVDPFQALEQNPNVIGDFRYQIKNGALPDPEMILSAIEGKSGSDYVTIIQPEYITECTCDNRGAIAKGHVEYRGGNVYAGSAEFMAQRQGDRWQIVAFRLPEYRLATRRQADGTWRLESEEELLGIAYP